MANAVEAALAEQGRLHARAKADVDNDGVLHVSITYLSPLVSIRQIKVTGAIRNPAAAVMGLAGLHIGDAIDLRKLEDAQQRLWESGRFNTHSISVDPSPDGDPKLADVTIDVQENQGPLIGEPFSPAEQKSCSSPDSGLPVLNTSADELAFDWSSKGQKSNDRLAARFVTGGHTGNRGRLPAVCVNRPAHDRSSGDRDPFDNPRRDSVAELAVGQIGPFGGGDRKPWHRVTERRQQSFEFCRRGRDSNPQIEAGNCRLAVRLSSYPGSGGEPRPYARLDVANSIAIGW